MRTIGDGDLLRDAVTLAGDAEGDFVVGDGYCCEGAMQEFAGNGWSDTLEAGQSRHVERR